LMLLKMPNVAVVSIDEFGDGGVQALAVGTLDEQYGGVFQSILRMTKECIENLHSD